MSPLAHRAQRSTRSLSPSLTATAALGLVGACAALTGCASSDPIGGCWETELDGGRTVSFFVDTDDDSVIGAETTGEGEDVVRTDFEGRLDGGGDSYGIDASCTGGGGANGCDGVADWSLRCTLDESGEEPVLRCTGAPFAGPTELTTCQGSATVPQ
jgi:hypothetical protein